MKKLLSLFMAAVLVLFNGFMLFEGSAANAGTSTFPWDVTLSVKTEAAFNCDHDTGSSTLSLGILYGLTGGDKEGKVECVVKTNNATGWDLYISDIGGFGGMMDSSNPTNTIAAYPASVPQPWVLGGAGNAYYGYYASSTHPVAGYGADLYRGLTNALVAVAGNSLPTASTGETTTFGFKVELGGAAAQPSGNYVSHVQATLVDR